MAKNYSIKDLVDIDRLRSVFEKFSIATGYTTGFVSYPEQEILIATGWRDICTKFHRSCAASAECCKDSNTYLTGCLRDLKEVSIKQCGNGLVDGATPVIIRGVHMASLATGQILLAPADRNVFRKQAKKYGYNTKEYLAALDKVPVVTEEQLKGALSFLAGVAVFIAEEGLNRIHIEESARALQDENARREQLEEELLKISEREKQLIAQELHDGICQHLAGVALMSKLLHGRLEAKRNSETDCAKQICNLLSISVEETRNLAHGLYPVKDEPNGLTDALSQLAKTVTNLFFIRCSFRCATPVFVDKTATATHLFRIAQEAVTNAIKHGEATRVLIRLHYGEEGIELSIRDDGIGIPSDYRSTGMGLQIMNHRASAIGASLVVGRAQKKGTIVCCTLPYPAS